VEKNSATPIFECPPLRALPLLPGTAQHIRLGIAFSWLNSHALAFVDAIEPKYVVVLVSRQCLFFGFPTGKTFNAHSDAVAEIHHGMIATGRDADATTIALNSTPERVRWWKMFHQMRIRWL
jgi:hypothetical protein